ncbi:hypothetical protein WDU94_003052 [Cyamophila willieti]
MSLCSQQDVDQSSVITQPYDGDELPDTPELDVELAPNSFEFPNLWGTLISIDSEMEHIELSKDEYTFGRDSLHVDFVLKHSSCPDDNFSRKHFTIGFNGSNREAYIIDNSTNGTFVNSHKLVKDVRHHLQHLTRISVISEKNKVFIFLEELQYQEVRSLLSDTILSKYFICDEVGKGCFGTVKLCIQKETKLYLAMKEVENAIDGDFKKYFASEVSNLKAVSHPNIITLYESFIYGDTIYMVLEFIPGGDLNRKMAECGKLGEADCRAIVYQIAMALHHLHSLNIVHRDLKPANILLKQVKPSNINIVKVCDFGLSKNIDASTLKSKVGTPMFVAPEVLFGNHYDQKVDVWSLGVMLYFCLSGKYPFPSEENSNHALLFEALKQGVTFSAHCWMSASRDVKNMLLRMIMLNPLKRCQVRDVLMHPWITKDQIMTNSLNNILLQELNNINAGNPVNLDTPFS